MYKLLVSENTQKVLTELVGLCFAENRYTDRLVSILGTKFAFNNTAGLIHQHIAHMYPALADQIGEKTLERYNIPVFYPSTPSGGQDYSSVTEIIKDLEERTIDFQIALMGACKTAQDNGDIHVYVDLLDMLEDFNEVVGQTILLSDKIDAYKGDIAFDSHVKEHFWLLG